MTATRAQLDREDDILKAALNQVRARLPQGWTLDLQVEPRLFGPDSVVSLGSPQGDAAPLLVEVKRSASSRATSGRSSNSSRPSRHRTLKAATAASGH